MQRERPEQIPPPEQITPSAPSPGYRLALIVEDVLTAAAIHHTSAPMQVAMIGLVIGLSLAIEDPRWANEVLQESSDERLVTTARRAAALRYAELVDDANAG